MRDLQLCNPNPVRSELQKVCNDIQYLFKTFQSFGMTISVCSSKSHSIAHASSHFYAHLQEKLPALFLNSYFLLTSKWSQIKHTGPKMKFV